MLLALLGLLPQYVDSVSTETFDGDIGKHEELEARVYF
jgi:hypothetical protein